MITILLADDQALIRKGFRLVLAGEDDFSVVGEAIDGADAVRQAARLGPDVVVMDVRMPGTDGIEATRRIVEAGSAKVLILTTFDLDEFAYAGLRAGASGFLLKDAPPGDLVSAIRSVASGDAVVAPSVTRRLLDAYADRLPAPGQASADDPRVARLTPREREIFVAMGEGLSNPELADRFVLSEGTVKTHVGRILAKLEVRDRVQAVVLAHRVGLVR
ncbi:response regulator transcription factor [Cryptosporangium japonicum]|uniref:Response regulator n=1 Tax=Cryptosporangium japonicum TaxID=80872 RepID=A0ABP3DU39_9ACTN